ncbi:MAG: DUF4157 domain-containing protein [Bacteroidota bacterium]
MKTSTSKDKSNNSAAGAKNIQNQSSSSAQQVIAGSEVTAQLAAMSLQIEKSPIITAQRKQMQIANQDEAAQLAAKKEEKKKVQGKFKNSNIGHAAQLKGVQANNTGLPDNLKSGVESLSGMSLNDVKVHYNSPKPAQLNALAYAQGTDIHIGPGQSKHLPHEAWHVAQQKQGRVKATTQAAGVAINDDKGLEKEADVMGAKAMQMKADEKKKKK